MCVALDPFRAPEPLLILNPSNFVPKNGFPVVKLCFFPSAGEDKKNTHKQRRRYVLVLLILLVEEAKKVSFVDDQRES